MEGKQIKIRRRNRKYRRLRRTYTAILAVVVLCAVLLCSQALLARYKTSNETQAEMISAQFHISSNYLGNVSENKEFSVVDWGDGIDVQLYNYEKENVALIAADAIRYKVTVTNGTFSVSDGASPVTPSGEEYTLPKSASRISQILHISPSGSGDVVVTVKTTAPFAKTLKATFKINSKLKPDYIIEDQSNGTVKITVYSNDYEGSITVQWDAGKFSPDNTNKLMETWSDVTKLGSFTAESNTVYELLFVKNTADAYSKTEGTGTKIGLGVTVSE